MRASQNLKPVGGRGGLPPLGKAPQGHGPGLGKADELKKKCIEVGVKRSGLNVNQVGKGENLGTKMTHTFRGKTEGGQRPQSLEKTLGRGKVQLGGGRPENERWNAAPLVSSQTEGGGIWKAPVLDTGCPLVSQTGTPGCAARVSVGLGFKMEPVRQPIIASSKGGNAARASSCLRLPAS